MESVSRIIVDYNIIDPMKIAVFPNITDWRYVGPHLKGVWTYWVKITNLGYLLNLSEAEKRVQEFGHQLMPGLSINSFINEFPEPDGKGAIVFGGSRWEDQFGVQYVIYLQNLAGKWVPNFHVANYEFSEKWFWTVIVRQEKVIFRSPKDIAMPLKD